jgi:hypothetical protein
MSCDIRKYNSLPVKGSLTQGTSLELTAFLGGEEGHCIQFTINGSYCCLSEKQIIDLIITLVNRIRCKTGYTATGEERENILYEE